MNVFILLDILLLILVALFVPIGFWRGTHREIMVTLGILLGASLAEWWARPWGNDLADLTSLRDTGGAFMVAVLFLIGSTFLLGYGAGAALPVPIPGMISRAFGAIVAAANGALLLSFALRDIRVYLLPNSDSGFLDKSVVAHFLSTGVGWILLGTAVGLLPIILVMALFGQSVVINEYVDDEGDDYETEYETAQRPYPPRVPSFQMAGAGQPTYKADPPRSFFSSPAEETRQISVQPSSSSEEFRGNLHEMQTVATRTTDSPSEVTRTMELAAAAPVDNSALQEGKCPACHADVREAEVYCPRCGRVL